MKANKALKRLTHAQDLVSDVMERYSAGSPDIQQQLLDAKAAVGRAKDAVSLQASSRPTKKPPFKRSGPPSKAATTSAQKKAATKKAAVKVPPAKATKKTAPSATEAAARL